MIANREEFRTVLVEEALSWLRKRLPDDWELRDSAPGPSNEDGAAHLTLQATGGYMATIVVEARESLSPREAAQLLQGFGQALRSINTATVLLVVAPWLSRGTQETLARQGINYIDLTGNALVRLSSPAVYLETEGEARNPNPKARAKAQLRGPRASRLIRLLADVRPPYGVRELAEAAQLAPGYTSQLLETLYDEALIERSRRGRVEDVDLTGLLRRWSTTYDVLRSNTPASFIAPEGVDDLLARLADDEAVATRIAITGSFAAVRLAPVAAPALLLAYSDLPPSLTQALGLLPASEGANVILLQPLDSVAWLRTSIDEGLRYAAPSQVAVDCMTGTGRMPAEGEALLDWLPANEPRWRRSSLRDLA
ncbi:MAG TPA: hypothetical protein VGV69_00210 [Solirubrobacterales bacterium]|nr:hypothetical protein [Solirubrobacterales bacterium]